MEENDNPNLSQEASVVKIELPTLEIAWKPNVENVETPTLPRIGQEEGELIKD